MYLDRPNSTDRPLYNQVPIVGLTLPAASVGPGLVNLVWQTVTIPTFRDQRPRA